MNQEHKRVSVNTLTPHPRNARVGDVDAIAASVKAHGQYKPLVVQRQAGDGTEMVVLAGNHTLQAMKQLGMSECDVVVIDVDDDQAARILLVDNRTSDNSGYDDQELADLLTTLNTEGGGLGRHGL